MNLAMARNDNLEDWWEVWEEKRRERGGDLPDRECLNPHALKGLLPRVWILDPVSADTATIRLCGSALVWHASLDVTGLNYFDLVPAERREDAKYTVAAMTEWPCGLIIKFSVDLARVHFGTVSAMGLPVFDSRLGRMVLMFVHNFPFSKPRIFGHRLGEAPVQKLVSRQFIDLGNGVPELPGKPIGQQIVPETG